MSSASAVVFAYSEVGARCLAALLESGIDVKLVVTHDDDPNEQRWFASVAEVARAAACEVRIPAEPTDPALLARLEAIAPDFIFSFYYRRMLPAAVLGTARRGALNMHGSLLPKYRGRAPVNWAVLNGETETGASLHYMVAKPDAGALIDQERVAIGPDETAVEVARHVADAAVVVLKRALPGLVAGTAVARPLELAQGSYFGGRKPADGEFSWEWPAARIHNLVRAVAPPFPGAFAPLGRALVRVNSTRRAGAVARPSDLGPNLYADGPRLIAECGDGGLLELGEAFLDARPLDGASFVSLFGRAPVPTRPQSRAPARATRP